MSQPVLKIVQAGDPVLRAGTSPVPASEIREPDVQRLVELMRETMRDAPGVGLAATHAVGVLHRDLKPSNLMLEPSPGRFERVVLIDFGFAALDGATGLTRQGIVVGSPSYLAPERIEGNGFDGRADVYSVGAILYEMLAGRPPFVGDPGHVLISHCREAPQPPSQLGVDVPPEMEAILLKSLAKSPDERPASAQAMADELELAMQ